MRSDSVRRNRSAVSRASSHTVPGTPSEGRSPSVLCGCSRRRWYSCLACCHSSASRVVCGWRRVRLVVGGVLSLVRCATVAFGDRVHPELARMCIRSGDGSCQVKVSRLGNKSVLVSAGPGNRIPSGETTSETRRPLLSVLVVDPAVGESLEVMVHPALRAPSSSGLVCPPSPGVVMVVLLHVVDIAFQAG